MTSLAAIMTEPDFAEVMFLVAFILFLIEVVVIVARPATWAYGGLLVAAGLAARRVGIPRTMNSVAAILADGVYVGGGVILLIVIVLILFLIFRR